MKLLGILWNSIGDKKDEAIKEIQKYGSVLYYDVDLGVDYKNFLQDLYPFNESEKWKADFKIKGLVNKYKNNSIRIVFMDIPISEKVYLKNKDKMMYKNVLDLKVYLRKKYKHLIIDNNTENQKSYDNVFHMTDDELEYEKDLCVLMEHIPFIFERKDGFLILDRFVDKEQTFLEKWGTRKKIWLNNKILFKENTEGTYESYCEVFNMYLLKQCGLNYASYDLANYEGKDGVITKNVLYDDEFMIDGSHIMSEDESYTKRELIEHNNLEMLENIIIDWCNKKGFKYNKQIIINLNKLFIYDLLTLQPDRNPSNYAIAVNKKTKETRLVYFDNSNMLFCDKKDILKQYEEGKLNLCDEIKKLKTFLLFKKEDTCFDDKIQIFKKYYELSDLSTRKYIKQLLKEIEISNIIKIFDNIENEKNLKLPLTFKKIIVEAYEIYHSSLYEILKDIDNLEKNNGKILQLKKNYNKMEE